MIGGYLHRLLLALSLAPSIISIPLSTDHKSTPHSYQSTFTFAPLLGASQPHGVINDSYIVILKPGVSHERLRNHFNFLQIAQDTYPLLDDGAGVHHVYDGLLSGYAGRFAAPLVDRLRSLPEVQYIEHDQVVHTMEPTDIVTQKGAPWGLARLSHRDKLSLGTYGRYAYDTHGGEGVDVYVVDTGINVHHVEFEGRASWGKTIVRNDVDEDRNGHGTHCAGIIASRKYGVAKAANVIAVKVLDSNGYGSTSDMIAGVAFVASAAKAKADEAQREYAATGRTAHKGSVVNMSLGVRGVSRAVTEAINTAADQGIHFAVAAGNDNADACKYTPASAEAAVTVGASTSIDARAYFSNHGPCIDVFAPGLNILSTFGGTDTATATLSGTSMASPHVAGLLAYLLSIYPSATFDPVFAKSSFPSMLTQEAFLIGSAPARLYTLIRAVLPSVVAELMPTFRPLAAAPRPDTLTPADLKAAVITLATRGALSGVASDTPNVLVFNNATSE